MLRPMERISLEERAVPSPKKQLSKIIPGPITTRTSGLEESHLKITSERQFRDGFR